MLPCYRVGLMFLVLALVCLPRHALAASSHPPLRVNPPASARPATSGPARYVDPSKGDDRAAGTLEQPWRSVGHALTEIVAGETLYLRQGTYYETLHVAVRGTADKPITIRSFPGEQATISGNFAEFVDAPATAWEPVVDGAPGEFRSTRRYPNIRDVVGSFGDSHIGLQTYYHQIDLAAQGETFVWPEGKKNTEADIAPIYLGPGLWRDPHTARIHARLAHTHLPAPIANYQGETDPRKLPLIVAPFESVPVYLNGAQHLVLQDLIIQGAGYTALVLDHTSHVTLDNLTIWCGAYGLRAGSTKIGRAHV